MVLCFICKQHLPTARKLLSHFDLFHSNHNFDKYFCIEINCNRTYHLRNSFIKHIKKHIVDDCSTFKDNESSTFNNEPGPSSGITQTNEVSPCLSTEMSTISRHDHSSVERFIASLYANPIIPRNAVQTMITGMDKFLKEGLSTCLRKLCDERVTGSLPQEMSTLLEEIMITIANPLDGFMTEYKRLEHFQTKGSYIPPTEIVIGQRMSDVRKQGIHFIEPCICSLQMVPLRLILKSFLSLPNVLTEIYDYKKQLELIPNLCKNYIQGSYWKSKNTAENVLPLFIFFDDFESGNVLGSHSGLHKLGAVYVSLANMPPYRLSSLSNLFLVLLFHSTDRTSFGNNAVFSPLIEELNYLKNTGIHLETPSYVGTVYFELALILGDNLGLHSILGFSESFSCNYPCRICKVEKDDLKNMCYEDTNLFRTSSDYKTDLDLGNVSLTGIKEPCVWLRLTGFSLFDQVGVDLMHDFFEGCAKYVMAYLISYYIKDLALFSLTVLNNRIFGFDYGPDTSSKPVAIRLEQLNSGNIKQSASEAWTLCRYFSLLVGDFIPFDEPSWDLYITLRKMLDILASPSIDQERIALLRTLIAEFNELYTKYSKEPLKPKFHFLTHYPTIMEKFGPVIHFWSMRYEAKHRISKISARSSFNRRNICKTLAIKHQLQLNELFITGKLDNLIQTGPETDIDLALHRDICSYLDIDLDNPLVKVSWAKVNGTLYKTGSIVTGEFSDEITDTVFYLIEDVFLYNLKIVIFMCKKFTTTDFDEHFYAFEVECPSGESEVFYTFQSMLACHVPNNLTYAPNGNKYITLRN